MTKSVGYCGCSEGVVDVLLRDESHVNVFARLPCIVRCGVGGVLGVVLCRLVLYVVLVVGGRVLSAWGGWYGMYIVGID